MLKRWVFNARRKEGCESMSLMSVGRLFQTSGPLTENACWPICVLVRRTTADLVVDDHSWRWCALGLNATRSLRYGGERWWKILYINVATLKVIWNFIGSQLNKERKKHLLISHFLAKISATNYQNRFTSPPCCCQISLHQNICHVANILFVLIFLLNLRCVENHLPARLYLSECLPFFHKQQ